MASTFDFGSLSNSGSNLNLSGVNLNYRSTKPGTMIYSSRANGTGIYSGNSNQSQVGFTGSVNGVPVVSNTQPSLFGNNRGSSLGTSSSTTSGGSSYSGGMSTQDWINTALAVGQLGYSIFNNERNYSNERQAYADALARDQRNYELDRNGYTNLVRQYAENGLNPLYASGNGTSIGSASQFSAPQHGSLDFMTTLSFIDKLRTSQVERDLMKAQANNTNAKTVAQAIVNELNEAKIDKTLADKGFTFEQIKKTKEQINRLKQLRVITDYDFNVTKTGIGARYKDPTPEPIAIANTLAGYATQDSQGLPNNVFGATTSTFLSLLLNLLKVML